jgi:hypothetical protein
MKCGLTAVSWLQGALRKREESTPIWSILDPEPEDPSEWVCTFRNSAEEVFSEWQRGLHWSGSRCCSTLLQPGSRSGSAVQSQQQCSPGLGVEVERQGQDPGSGSLQIGYLDYFPSFSNNIYIYSLKLSFKNRVCQDFDSFSICTGNKTSFLSRKIRMFRRQTSTKKHGDPVATLTCPIAKISHHFSGNISGILFIYWRHRVCII